MLAEERRWRLKLDAVQDSLDKHGASIDALQKQSSGLEARLVAHDADSRRGASATQKVEAQVSDLQNQVRSLQPSLDEHTETLRTLTKRSDELEGKVSATGEELKTSTSEIEALTKRSDELEGKVSATSEELKTSASEIEALTKRSDELEGKVSAISEEVKTSASSLFKIEDQVRENEAAGLEVQAEVTRRIEQLGEQSAKLAERIAAQGVEIGQGIELTKGLKTQIDGSEERCLQLSEAVHSQGETVSSLIDQSSNFTEKLAKQGAEICSADALARKIQSQVQAAEKERLAELRVVCEKLEVQNDSISAVSSKVQTQISDVEEGLVRALAELSAETSTRLETKADRGMVDEALDSRDQRLAEVAGQLAELMAGEERINMRMSELAKLAEALDSRDVRFDALREELKGGLADKASAAQLKQATETLHAWVQEVRETLSAWSQRAHQNTTAELEHTRSVTADHGVMLKRHSHLLENISHWCQQVRVREQGLTHVIMHVVEKSSPEQLKMFEEVLSVPQLRRA